MLRLCFRLCSRPLALHAVHLDLQILILVVWGGLVWYFHHEMQASAGLLNCRACAVIFNKRAPFGLCMDLPLHWLLHFIVRMSSQPVSSGH